MEKTSSKLLASALIKDKLDTTFEEKMVKIGSFHGYKKVVLFWLREMQKNTKDKQKKKLIDKRITILTSCK